MRPRRALVSVSDKTYLHELCSFLYKEEVEIISTGGTAKVLEKYNIPYIPIEQITHKPEIFGGRVKSLSFEISSALLYRREHFQDCVEAETQGVIPIDLVVCNLYPFTQSCSAGAELDVLVDMIDVGGATMIRAGAKNFSSVTVITDPMDYNDLMNEWMMDIKGISYKSRKHYALKAFSLLASYDLSISMELSRKFNDRKQVGLGLEKLPLRYGENPHQQAAFYFFPNSLVNDKSWSQQITQDKLLSYNNYLDVDQAYKCVSELKTIDPKLNHVVIIKHGNPCGAATHGELLKALTLAWQCDAMSAFGSVVSISETITEEVALWILRHFIEVLIAPSITETAKIILKEKKNLRLIIRELKGKAAMEWSARSVCGGLLWQEEDEGLNSEWEDVTKEKMKLEFKKLAPFAMTITKYLKSNAIGLFGIKDEGKVIAASGVGQPNRLDCLKRLAGPKAMENGWNPQELLLVSDAFFPFDDVVREAKKLGIMNIIQPGGSLKDHEVIKSCDELGVIMVFTRERHFRH